MSDSFSAKEAALQLGTDARTLRKFLRSSISPFEPVGQGSRYTFDKGEMKRLRKHFDAWSARSTKKEIESAQPRSDHVDPPDIDDDLTPDDFPDLTELDGPSDEEIFELDDVEYEDI